MDARAADGADNAPMQCVCVGANIYIVDWWEGHMPCETNLAGSVHLQQEEAKIVVEMVHGAGAASRVAARLGQCRGARRPHLRRRQAQGDCRALSRAPSRAHGVLVRRKVFNFLLRTKLGTLRDRVRDSLVASSP